MKESSLVIVESIHSSPVVQEQLGHEPVTSFTRPVEGSLQVIAESIHSSSAVQEQPGHGFVAIHAC